jgi:hypothetical protein
MITIVIDIENIDFFIINTLIFLQKFLQNFEYIYVLIPQNVIQYISYYKKLSNLPIKYISKSIYTSFTINSIITTELYLLLNETHFLKDSLSINDLYYDNKIVCTLESFPHGLLDFTTNRHEWYHAYNILQLTINSSLYENKCMTKSPQILITNVVQQIFQQYNICSLPIYWFYLYKHNLYNKYIETNLLWNKELSHNALHSTIPYEYLASNINTGYNNNSKFIIISPNLLSLLSLYKCISVQYVKEILDELNIYKTNFNFVRLGELRDGGYVICDIPTDILYSYGIGNTYKFENDFVNHFNSKICYMYDHTVDLQLTNPKLVHIKLGIDYYSHSVFNTIEEQLKKNNDWGNKNLTLKIDVEGYEWLSLLFISDECLQQFKQIVIELHWLDTDMNATVLNKINVLKKLNQYYALVHIHPVNCQNLVHIGNYALPPVIECTYVRKDICTYIILNKSPSLPSVLDKPMDACLREISLSDYYPWKFIL